MSETDIINRHQKPNLFDGFTERRTSKSEAFACGEEFERTREGGSPLKLAFFIIIYIHSIPAFYNLIPSVLLTILLLIIPMDNK